MSSLFSTINPHKPLLIISTSFLISISFYNVAHAGLLIQRPLYIGLSNGLVGNWSFDGPDMADNTAFDRSGQGNDGTLTNGPTRQIGRIGQALKFDGSNDYVDLGSASSIDDLDVFTYTAWIYIKSFPAGNRAGIITQGLNDRLCEVDNRGGASGDKTLRLTTDRGTDTNLIAADDLLTTNRWYHVACVFDLNGTNRLYIDGSEPSYGTNTQGSGILSDDPGQLVIIGAFDPPGNEFNGLIDDVRVYNRALSSDEIKRLYKIGATTKINSPLLSKGNITFDAASNSGGQSGVSSFSWNHTASGLNRLLVVGVVTSDGANLRTVTRITYGGKALTKARNDLSGNRDAEIWYLANPPGGTNSVSVTLTASVDRVMGGAISFNGADQTSPLDANNGTTGDSTAPSVDVVTKTNGAVVVDSLFYRDDTTDASCTAGAGQTKQVTVTNGASSQFGMSNKGPQSPAGSVTMSYSCTGASTPWIISAAAFKPLKLFTVNKSPNTGSIQNGLVGYWSFDGPDMAGNTAFDRSGQGNDGILTNGPKRQIGRIGQALEFDGVNDNVDLPVIVGNSKTIWSISAWIKTDMTAIGAIWSEADDNVGGDSEITMDINVTDAGKLRVTTRNGGDIDSIAVATAINNGQFHHVAATRDGSTIILYKDGVQIGSNTAVTASPPNQNDAAIGTHPNNNSNFFDGLIDDVRVYNRALSSDEIKRLYNIGR